MLYQHIGMYACTRGILDHDCLGERAEDGWCTKRTDCGQHLKQAGDTGWTTLAEFWQRREVLAGVPGAGRVLLNREGCNALGTVHDGGTAPVEPEASPATVCPATGDATLHGRGQQGFHGTAPEPYA